MDKSSLSVPRQRLLEQMRDLNFGRIEDLVIVDGEPVMDPRPRIVRKYKFDAKNGPRPEHGNADFRLKQKTRELFDCFDDLKDGVINVLQIQHGLPFDMELTEAPA